MRRDYSLSSDLLVLATKAFKNGDIKGSAKLFAHACLSKDLPVFVNQALETAGDKGLTLPMVSRRVLASVEAAFQEAQGPLSPDELRIILGKIKQSAHACNDCGCEDGFKVTTGDEEDSEDFDEETIASMDNANEFSLDTDGDDTDEQQEQEDADEEEWESEHEVEGTQEEELSSSVQQDLVESVKNSLVALKVRSNDWEVKKFMPVLMKFFPDLIIDDDLETDIGQSVNKILNRLHKIDYRTLTKLDTVLRPLREN
jgi:hypothetical protein